VVAVLAARTLAVLSARHSELIALTIVFAAARLLTVAALAMLGSNKLLFKSLRVSFYYLSASLMSFVLVIISIVAIRTSALFITHPAVCEAFTIKLQAFCFRTTAYFMVCIV